MPLRTRCADSEPCVSLAHTGRSLDRRLLGGRSAGVRPAPWLCGQAPVQTLALQRCATKWQAKRDAASWLPRDCSTLSAPSVEKARQHSVYTLSKLTGICAIDVGAHIMNQRDMLHFRALIPYHAKICCLHQSTRTSVFPDIRGALQKNASNTERVRQISFSRNLVSMIFPWFSQTWALSQNSLRTYPSFTYCIMFTWNIGVTVKVSRKQ